MRRIALGIFSIAGVFFILLIGHSYITQDEAIFRSLPLAEDHQFSFEAKFDEVFLPVGERGRVHGLHFKTEGARGVVLFLHGRGRNLSHWGKRADFFLEHGLDIFMIDYRGFGKSSPGFKEEWLLEDSLEAYDYLKQIYSEEQITVYGNSLGTAMATWVAANLHPAKLILEAPYYSMLAAAAYTKPYLPVWPIRAVLKYPLQTHKWVAKVSAPIYIFHGKDDTIVPFIQGQLLYEKIRRHNDSVEFIPLEKWGHSQVEHHLHYQLKMAQIL